MTQVVWDDSGERAARERMRLEMEVNYCDHVDDGEDNNADADADADADALYNFRRGKTSRFSGIWTNGETQYDHICRELLCTCIFFK